MLVISGIIYAQDSEMPLDNGIHLLAHISSAKATPTTYGVDFGSTWNVFKPEGIPLAIGARVSWIDGAFGGEEVSANVSRQVLIGSVLSFAPNVTYKVIDQLGIEAYFKLKPTVYVNALIDNSNLPGIEENGSTTSGFGISNAFGLGVRYNIFQLGVEFGGGSLNTTTTFDQNQDDFDSKVTFDYTRFFIGLRF